MSGVNASRRYSGIVGRRFHRLIVKSFAVATDGRTALRCKCDCGRLVIVNRPNLLFRRSGRQVKSCGCLKREGWKHGGCRLPEYAIWKALIQRCTNRRHKGFKDYGGRGIVVSPRWRDFRNFLADVGRRPAKWLTIERKKNNRGYVPGNVVWASRAAQARNTRRNVKLMYLGEIRCIGDWACDTRCNVSLKTLSKRLRSGWSMRRAMCTPPSPGVRGASQWL
jgi:hypothetical protein